MGRNFIIIDEKSHLMTSWKVCTNLRIRESEKDQDRIGIV